MKETSQRILEAATRIFARDGVSGGTTREIARAARVNEVTLFRYFKNKNELLRRVILQSSRRYEHVFSAAAFETPDDLRHTVQSFAEIHARVLLENEDFVRTFIGEMNRHLKLCKSLFVGSAKPARQKFINYLQAAQKAGVIRKDVDVTLAADALSGMLLTGVLRRPLTEPFYTNERYVETCVALFLKGIEA